MSEYIEREALMKNFCGYDLTKCVKYGNKDAGQQHDSYSTMMMYEIADEIMDAPAADVVSAAAYRQVAWERDLALQQLRGDYGVGLGEKKADVAPVVHGRWHDVYMSSPSSFVGTCSVCGISNDIPPVCMAHFCPNCGARMDKEADHE